MGEAGTEIADDPDHADDAVGADGVSGVEAAVLGLRHRADVDTWVSRALGLLVGERVRAVLFGSGRIDAVYGLVTDTDARLLLKVHRPPVDVEARRLVVRAQHLLADAGFPCARPLAGPTLVDDKVVSVETLLPEGERADGHDPLIRTAVADGLAEQVTVLAAHPELVAVIGRPPAWCDYYGGAWASTHDPVFDFRTTPPEYGWLQEFAQDAADVLNDAKNGSPRVAAHADWYCGNLRFDRTRLVAAFDWDLFADAEPVVAGITAGMFSSGTSEIAGPPTPGDAAEFLADYETARGIRFAAAERTVAAAAVRWSIAYTARCDVTLRRGETPAPGSALDLLAISRADYFQLDW
jgi:Phosphotransferase enzyme family